MNESVKRIVTICALTTGRNPEVVASMSPAERARVCVESAMLAALTVLAFVQWFTLLGSESTFRGIAGATVFTVLVIGFDIVMGASLEREYGANGAQASKWATIGRRLAFSTICASVLSTAFALNQFAPQIDAQNRRNASATNEPLRAEYQQRLQDSRKDTVTPLEAAIAVKMKEREVSIRRVGELGRVVSQFAQTAVTEARESLRQREGVLGAKNGEGPLYRFAATQQRAAEASAARAEQEAATEASRADEINEELRNLRAQHATAIAGFGDIERGLEIKLINDPRYISVGTDFLSRFVGLLRLMSDPRYGSAIMLMVIAVFLLFVALECAYMLCKLAHHGNTYAQRDLLREHRDLERWGQSMHEQIVRDAEAYRSRTAPMNMPRQANDSSQEAMDRLDRSGVFELRPVRPTREIGGE